MPDPMSVRDAAELARLQETGERLKFLFFWGHTPPRAGAPGTACLSQ